MTRPRESSLEDASRNLEPLGFVLGVIGQVIPSRLLVKLHLAAFLLRLEFVQKTNRRKCFGDLLDGLGHVRNFVAESPHEPVSVLAGVSRLGTGHPRIRHDGVLECVRTL